MLDDIVVGLLISIGLLFLLAVLSKLCTYFVGLLRNDFSFMQLMNDKFCCICFALFVLTNWLQLEVLGCL